jgi:hypothetical protein
MENVEAVEAVEDVENDNLYFSNWGYNEKLANEVCNKVIDGISINKICLMKGMPTKKQLFKWIEYVDGFKDMFKNANEIKLICMIDGIYDYLELNKIKCIDNFGNSKLDAGQVAANRLYVETLKWHVSKHLEEYKDKPVYNNNNNNNNNDVNNVLSKLIEKLPN